MGSGIDHEGKAIGGVISGGSAAREEYALWSLRFGGATHLSADGALLLRYRRPSVHGQRGHARGTNETMGETQSECLEGCLKEVRDAR